MELGSSDEALESCDRALKARPDYTDALYNRGKVLLALERFEDARLSYEAALAREPDRIDTLNNLGLALTGLGQPEAALVAYDKVLAIDPGHLGALLNRANSLVELERFEEALVMCGQVLSANPTQAEAHNTRGVALGKLVRYDEALASYDRAIALQPKFVEAHSNRGTALHELKRHEEALASYDHALALRPDYAEAHANRGNALKELRRLPQALASYERALELRPDLADAHFSDAMCRLLIGDFARGWQQHEWRWETAQLRKAKRHFLQPLWIGADDIAGKTILLHAEQGFGDTLQFCRYVPRVVERGAHVILEVPKPLRELMRTLSCTVQIVSAGDLVPPFDLHCPLLSLPLAFGTQIETIPSQTPYLSAPENKRIVWRDRLGKHERPRIGLVWAGDPRKNLLGANRIDRQRSLRFEQLAPVLQVRGCDFYSLQKGDDAQAQLRNSALDHGIVDWSADFHDFSDTAALIENLDLVIAVDTAVAHLAGALGKPLWLINRYNTCWRWLLDRDDSPWYPAARLFRQDESRVWDGVIARVQAALTDYVGNL